MIFGKNNLFSNRCPQDKLPYKGRPYSIVLERYKHERNRAFLEWSDANLKGNQGNHPFILNWTCYPFGREMLQILAKSIFGFETGVSVPPLCLNITQKLCKSDPLSRQFCWLIWSFLESLPSVLLQFEVLHEKCSDSNSISANNLFVCLRKIFLKKYCSGGCKNFSIAS